MAVTVPEGPFEDEKAMGNDPILQPQRVGSLTLPNRVVMTTVKLGYATRRGEVTDRHLAFYARRARGGVGLLTTEPLYIQSNGRELPTQLGIHEESLMAGLETLVKGVHSAGGRIMAHLNHAGRAANPKLVPEGQLVSASDVVCPANQGVPRSLSLGEIGPRGALQPARRLDFVPAALEQPQRELILRGRMPALRGP